MEHTTIAVDLAKSVFQVAVSHRPGRVDEERRLSRDRFLAFFAQCPPATVVLENVLAGRQQSFDRRPFRLRSSSYGATSAVLLTSYFLLLSSSDLYSPRSPVSTARMRDRHRCRARPGIAGR